MTETRQPVICACCGWTGWSGGSLPPQPRTGGNVMERMLLLWLWRRALRRPEALSLPIGQHRISAGPEVIVITRVDGRG